MTLLEQMVWGTVILGICSAVHVVAIATAAHWMSGFENKNGKRSWRLNPTILLALAFAVIILAHTVQMWIWAVTFVYLNAIPDIEAALYFAMITNTTLGYGDLVLPGQFRIFGAFAAVTGLLTFGLSTAFLVGLISWLLPKAKR